MEYVPYLYIGDLHFGMNRKKIRLQYGTHRAFKCGFPIENRHGDDFGTFHAYYTSKFVLEAVSLFPPCSFTCRGKQINVSNDATEIVNNLKDITDDVKFSAFDQSYYSKKLGLVIFCPDNAVENVLFFDEHYYDEENAYLKKNFGVEKFEL